MTEHGVVEVRAAEVVDADRDAHGSEGAVGALAQDDGVEGAAAEVVDGEGLSGLHDAARLVVTGGGLGLGDQVDVLDAQLVERREDQADAVRTPRGGVGEHHRFGAGALTLDDGVDHGRHGVRPQLLGRDRPSAGHHRHIVADAALELADESLRLRDAATFGGVSDQQLAVIGDEHHRGGAVVAATQRERCRDDAAVGRDARRCRSDPRRSDVDPQEIRSPSSQVLISPKRVDSGTSPGSAPIRLCLPRCSSLSGLSCESGVPPRMIHTSSDVR